jgi:hypothetical protein
LGIWRAGALLTVQERQTVNKQELLKRLDGMLDQMQRDRSVSETFSLIGLFNRKVSEPRTMGGATEPLPLDSWFKMIGSREAYKQPCLGTPVPLLEIRIQFSAGCCYFSKWASKSGDFPVIKRYLICEQSQV